MNITRTDLVNIISSIEALEHHNIRGVDSFVVAFGCLKVILSSEIDPGQDNVQYNIQDLIWLPGK